jgi:hypothetical protein
MRLVLLCVAVLLAALAAGVPDQGRRRKVKKILATSSPLPDESGLEATAMTPAETGAVQPDAESGGELGKDDNQKAPRG